MFQTTNQIISPASIGFSSFGWPLEPSVGASCAFPALPPYPIAVAPCIAPPYLGKEVREVSEDLPISVQVLRKRWMVNVGSLDFGRMIWQSVGNPRRQLKDRFSLWKLSVFVPLTLQSWILSPLESRRWELSKHFQTHRFLIYRPSMSYISIISNLFWGVNLGLTTERYS